jgi:glycosyltransferase involved in cell wall biosynthesis
MIIGIDAVHLSRSRKGIGRVERSLIQTLAMQFNYHRFVVFLDCDHTSLGLPIYDAVTYAVSPSGSLFVWEQFHLPRLARRYKIDCLLSLSDRIPLALVGSIVMYLFEVPDYRREMALSNCDVSVYQRTSDMITQVLFPCSLRRAQHVAVASRATERDLLTRYGISGERISVVPAAADECFKPKSDPSYRVKVRERYGARNGCVLHFSSGDMRDNTALALRAFAQARISPETKIIVAGGASSEWDNISDAEASLGLSERVLPVGYVSDSDLVDLYRVADVYLDPSLYEGFGLHVLEAMACGAPVVCSNTTSLPEIVGDAAITCETNDVDAFAVGLESVLNDSDRAAAMSAAGIRQAQQFSWQRTARELVCICERGAA